jgi:GT2 family glycosyltransferase
LAPEIQLTSFGRFRQALEDKIVDAARTGAPPDNFCTAANMSIAREVWDHLGGFDPVLDAAEDQDLALRHAARGGRIVFVEGAVVIHRDAVAGISAYCRRTRAGAAALSAFCRKHPGFVDNLERERVNGRVRWGAEPRRLSVKKVVKTLLSLPPVHACLLGATLLLERTAPESQALGRAYRTLLGVNMQAGYRAGRFGSERGGERS